MGVSFLALSAFHNSLDNLVSDSSVNSKIEELRAKISSMTEMDQKVMDVGSAGIVDLKITAIHPITNQEIPIYVADYVIDDYASGAVMGVPAHDERDSNLAKMAGLQSITVLENGKLINSQRFTGMTFDEFKLAIEVEFKDSIQQCDTYRLRDWLVSRQRYWGVPIPIKKSKRNGEILRAEPEYSMNRIEMKELHNYNIPTENEEFSFEQDTLDTFVDSSWYFLRFLDPKNNTKLVDKELADKWMPVDAYIGGMEHADKHLIYARFIHKFLRDSGYVSHDEPFKNIIAQGLVKGATYKLKSTGEYITKTIAESLPVADIEESYDKMSKSKLNGISPIEFAESFGIDTVRMAVLSLSPVESDVIVTHESMRKIANKLNKVDRFISLLDRKRIDKTSNISPTACTIFDEYISGFNYQRCALHVSTARVYELYNYISKRESIILEEVRLLLTMLYPFAPFLSSELWRKLNSIVNDCNMHSLHLSSINRYVEYIQGAKKSWKIMSKGKFIKNMQITSDLDADIKRITNDLIKENAINNESVARVLKDKLIINFI